MGLDKASSMSAGTKKGTALWAVCVSVAVLLSIAWSGKISAQSSPVKQSPQNSSVPTPLAPSGNVSSDSINPKTIEDWTTPFLAGSDLEPWAVIAGDVDTIDGIYTHEVTRVQWRGSDPIDLYIMKPVGVKNPPVILYLYSYPFETDRFLNHDVCKFLTKNGFAAVGFASALTGHRYHDRPMKEWFVSELKESLSVSAHDVQMILNYLTTRGDLDMNRVGMFGDGSGATIAILAAGADSRIKTLDLLDPWGDWPDWIAKSTRIPGNERPNFMRPEWLANVAPLDPLQWLPKLTTQKIRIQFIKKLPITPVEIQQKLEASAPPNAQIVHYDDTEAFRSAMAGGTGFDWIKQETRGTPAKQYRANSQSVKPSQPGKSGP